MCGNDLPKLKHGSWVVISFNLGSFDSIDQCFKMICLAANWFNQLADGQKSNLHLF